jgi:hypothetical protein
LRFFYRFLSADQSKLALGEQQQVLNSIDKSLPQFMKNYTWREICQVWLMRACARDVIPVSIERVGSEWRRSYTVDVVGVDETKRNLVLGACVWNESPVNIDPIKDLIKRTSAIVPKDEAWSVFYVGFAARGWKDGANEEASQLVQTTTNNKSWQTIGVRLLDLNEVDADLRSWSIAPPLM